MEHRFWRSPWFSVLRMLTKTTSKWPWLLLPPFSLYLYKGLLILAIANLSLSSLQISSKRSPGRLFLWKLIIHHACWLVWPTILPRFGASICMQGIIPSQCHCLRFIVFRPLNKEYLALRSSALQDWEHTIETPQEELILLSLTLCMYFADFYSTCHATLFRQQLGRKEGTVKVGRTYMHILRHLQKLRAHRFNEMFVHAAWPWTCTRKGWNTARKARWIVDKDVFALERRLKRRVMGEDYDSASRGKNKLPKSRWLKNHEMYEEICCWCLHCGSVYHGDR